jgi:hypothetical protein
MPDSLGSIGATRPHIYRQFPETTNGPYANVRAVVKHRVIRGANRTLRVLRQAAGAFTVVKISSASA